MANEDEDEELLAEVKKALKPDPPALKRMKENAKALGKKLPKKS